MDSFEQQPLTTLLPLRGLAVTLELLRSAEFAFFHQAAVHAFVRHLAGSPSDFASLLTLDAPESGRIRYRAGDRYRFALLGLSGAEILIARLMTALADLPVSAVVRDVKVPLRDNLRLIALHDLFSGEPVETIADLSLYDGERLGAEIALWQTAPFVQLQWLSPVRLLRAKERHGDQDGEARFCHSCADLADGVLAARVYDSIAELLRQRGAELPPRQVAPGIPAPNGNLFWVDSDYRDAAGQTSPIGGLCGRIDIGPGRELAPDWLRLLVLGQYLGIGQRRAFGLGRYRLRTPDGACTAAEIGPAASLLVHAAREDHLYDAYVAIRENLAQHGARNTPAEPDGLDDFDLPDPEEETQLADRLESIGRHLAAADYRPPPVQGIVNREDDGDLRGLAIPPFWDRVAQRAVNDCIAPACDLLLSPASHGYRRGRSRFTASLDVNRAWRQGYRWIYEADIEDFFDSVDWQHLRLRLEALYRDDPVVDLILDWMAAPVDYQGFKVQRTMGLPQGAPLSPTMANLMLDDFDGDLERAGFRLVRYADDCAPRRRVAGRKPCVQPCCTSDEGRPLEAAVQAEASNHPLLLRLRGAVVSELGKGRARSGQVRTVESNASEPLMRCRKRRNDVKTGGLSLTRDQSGRNLFTAQMASGIKAARMRSRHLCGTWEPVTPMLREPRKGRSPECVSTEAGYRDGATRSSEEGPVMGLERRGCPIRPESCAQPARGGRA